MSPTISRIYLDHAATTAVHPDVVEAMLPWFGADGGYNPSSQHLEGRRARAGLDAARDAVAAALLVDRGELVFTGSGSESDNQAIAGAARALRDRGRRIVSTATEHHAVLHVLEALADEGFDVAPVGVDGSGRIDMDELRAAVCPGTTVVSVMYANNELGVVQPLREIAAVAHAAGALFHTDAVQAAPWLPIRPRDIGADFVSLSAHKFYGPKGVGLLYARAGAPVRSLVYGGGQERGRRAGTENVAGIVGFAAALQRAGLGSEARHRRVKAMRDRFEQGLSGRIEDLRINGREAERLPNISHVSFAGVDSEALLTALDLEGVAVSAGSACTSGALEPSHVVAALGIDPRWHRGVIRFSLGDGTTDADVERVLEIVPRVVDRLRGNSLSARTADAPF